jgi:hypothetical protein
MKTKILLLFISTLLIATSCKKEDPNPDSGLTNAVTGTYIGTFEHELFGTITKKLVLKGDMTATFYETKMGSTETYQGSYTFDSTQVIHTFTDPYIGVATTIYTRVGNDLEETGICVMEKQ